MGNEVKPEAYLGAHTFNDPDTLLEVPIRQKYDEEEAEPPSLALHWVLTVLESLDELSRFLIWFKVQ